MSPIRLALISGGKSTEREVSLASGKEILAHLDPKRYRVSLYDPRDDLARLLNDAPQLDVAFPALHGLYGEDGSVQGFLTLLGLPYVGSGILSSALAIDKRITKDLYRSANLPVARDLVLNRAAIQGSDRKYDILQILGDLKLPLVVKPINQGSSVGLSIVKTKEELTLALDLAFKYGADVMLESYLEGREYTVAVIGNSHPIALPPIEIIPAEGHGFFDYSAKYDPGECQEICPCDLPAKETEEVSSLALKAHRLLGCRGLSRTDFILVDEVFYLLETNTLPGLTSQSLVPKAAKAYGLSFAALLDRLIELALEPNF
ncbi:MAG: D-alanine--D-alanine ligase [Deltaproteobacteria bacterium]|nr:D-alanine--D-alanine ligase [Deltaproteobacteria bacterium]